MMKDKLKEIFSKNKIAVIIGAVALVAIIVGIIIALVSCGGNDGQDNTPKGKVDYTLNIQTEGGMVFKDINVYVYNGGVNDDLINAGRTDENGQFKFSTDVAVDSLGVSLQGLPEEGYDVKEIFKISETKGEKKNQLYVYVKTVIEPLEDMDNTKFELGSIIKDFTVSTVDGEEMTISKLLEEKDAVVLNFFYLGCVPCKNEMPYLEEAYKKYGDSIALIAMTPIDKDDEKIKEYMKELGLTFDVAQCASEWETMMGIKAYPTTVVIDKWGMISFVHEGAVTEEGVFEAVFGYFTADNYKQHTVKYIDDIITASAEEGTESNPKEILPDATEFEAKVPAGKKMYFEISKVTNMILTIEDEDANIIYEDESYEAVDGKVSVVISAPDSYTPAKFSILNKGTTDKTFKVTLSAVKGTMMNPYVLELGEIKTEIEAGNEQGVYHTFTATDNGTLTFKPVGSTDNVKYDVTLYNLDTYVSRALSNDADEDGNVSIVVDKGNVIQIIISAIPNENNEYPATTVTGELSFEAGEGTGIVKEDIEYVVTVKDADGKALSGVNIVIDTAELVTDASGIAKATLKSGSYMVAITPPDGLKVQGEVTVTVDNPKVTVTLVSINAKIIDYKVNVTDESGKALNNATVIVGNSVSSTDASGVATFSLAEGTYEVTASASGYEPGSGTVTKSSTSATIKLKKSSGTTAGSTYTVNVVDYSNKALSGVTVIFKSGGVAKSTATTDASGKATAQLAKGNYDVTLVYDGYGYDSSSAKLTSSQVSVTLMMAKVATSKEDVYFDPTGAHKISTGSTYVEIPSEDSNNSEYGGNGFFTFTPRKSGLYKVTVSNPSAIISYWGDANATVNNITKEVEHTNTSVTINVKSEGPTFAIGVKGVSNCIITIEKIGEAIFTDIDMAWTDYVGTDVIKQYTFAGGTLTYVDITKSTSTYNLVYNTADGYYHLNSANGPVMLVHLGSGAPYVALSDVIGFTGTGGSNFGKWIYNGSTLVKKENYTSLLWTYMENMDQTKSVYPLTKDLMYILKNGGEFRGWWKSSGNDNIIYNQTPNLNAEIAWMWSCCYVAQ